MQLTKFFDLKKAITRIGVDKFEQNILNRVSLGTLEANEETTILGDYGVYYLEKGILVKVLVHITGKDKRWIEKKEKAIEAFNSKRYDEEDFIKALHKYHFTKCTTLNTMFAGGKGHKYFMSQATDGYFNYNITAENSVVYQSKEQKLNVCKNCLKVLTELTNNEYQAREFTIKNIFDTNIIKLSNVEFDLDCKSVPNIYSNDWGLISNKAKEAVNWTCESCEKKPKNRRDLHCHHIDSSRNNNLVSNLRVLCASCHSDEHSHMKKQNINYE
jgi:RNase P subunit RPR2